MAIEGKRVAPIIPIFRTIYSDSLNLAELMSNFGAAGLNLLVATGEILWLLRSAEGAKRRPRAKRLFQSSPISGASPVVASLELP